MIGWRLKTDPGAVRMGQAAVRGGRSAASRDGRRANGPESGVCLVAEDQQGDQASRKGVRQRKNVRDQIREAIGGQKT